MKATGIVRRIDADVIITPIFIHSKSEVNFTSLFVGAFQLDNSFCKLVL